MTLRRCLERLRFLPEPRTGLYAAATLPVVVELDRGPSPRRPAREHVAKSTSLRSLKSKNPPGCSTHLPERELETLRTATAPSVAGARVVSRR